MIAAVNLFLDLFRHQAWADAALLSAVHAHEVSRSDERILKALRHILRAQRVMQVRFRGGSADEVREIPPEFGAMTALYRSTHAEELAFVSGLSEADLERRFELPVLEIHPTVAEGLMHVVLHSQSHRGQCLTRLRENGATPPQLDYIAWTKDRPAPAWPEV
jgi:uncharacterized damage-inducible protein DinB